VRDKLYAYLLERRAGATPSELLDLIFTRPGSDAEVGPRFLHSLLEDDSRFVWCANDGRWRVRVNDDARKPLSDTTFVVIDVETTGGSMGDSAIIELAAARVRNGTIVEEFQQLVDPRRPVPPFVSRLTGIDAGMLAGQATIDAVLPRFKAFLGRDVVVAHNAPFDMGMLNTVALVLGDDGLDAPFLCSLKLAKRLFPELRRRSLDALASHFGVPVYDRHRALSDVRITTEVFFHLLETLRERGISRLGQALDLQDSARDGRPFTCGLSRDVVRRLPAGPGVYRFFDDSGKLLYVGRAKNLRQRVSSYMSNAGGHSDKTLDLIRHARDVRVQVAGSGLEAALEESTAIRSEKPPYNRLGKHLPRSAFLKLTVEDPYPRLSIVRKIGRGKGRMIGPFADRKSAERAQGLLTRLFRLRTCPGTLKPDAKAEICFQGQVDACSAPCAARVSEHVYRRQVDECLAFVDGNVEPVRQQLKRQREELSAGARFEAAARVQGDLETLRRLVRRQRTLGWMTERQHFLILQRAAAGRTVIAYLVVAGRLVWRGRLSDEAHVAEVARQAADRLAGGNGDGLPAEEIDGTTIVAAWLRDRREDDGCVFRIEAEEAPATRETEWRAACASLLDLPAMPRAHDIDLLPTQNSDEER
jgi:DNA polymerase-3 subunit epsilon